jgi:DNA-binding transcriptional LysR family regulator
MSRIAGMELRHLTVFVAVAEEASFTRAADRLHMVQSAVSASVRGLERELGAALFDRTTRRVELTDAGDALLPEARQVLAAVTVAREAVDQVSGGLRGTLRLGTMQGQAMRPISVPRLVAGFRAEHPGVEVHVSHTGGSVAMAEQVRTGRLDLAFVSLPDRRPSGLTLTPISSERMWWTESAMVPHSVPSSSRYWHSGCSYSCWRRLIPHRRRTTQQKEVRPRGPTTSKPASSPPVGILPTSSHITDTPNRNSKPRSGSD